MILIANPPNSNNVFDVYYVIIIYKGPYLSKNPVCWVKAEINLLLLAVSLHKCRMQIIGKIAMFQ